MTQEYGTGREPRIPGWTRSVARRRRVGKCGRYRPAKHPEAQDLQARQVLRTAVNRAIEIRAAHPQTSLPEAGIMDRTRWLLESFELAKDKAYQGGRVPGGQEGSEILPLPAAYGQQVKAVCERRAALAGYRLAALLQELM